MMNALFFIILCLTASCTTVLLPSSQYSRVVACFDPLGVNGTYNVTTKSRIRCAVSCSSRPECTSFSFKEEDDGGSCYLNSNVGLTDTGCVNQFQTFMLDNGEDQVCNGHGVYLMNMNKCRCFDGYLGDNCERLMQDCTEGSKYYLQEKGPFFIQPRSSTSVFRVYCNMIWGGRTYLMIKDRNVPDINFTRSWQDYKDGFGVYTKSSFWSGNEMLHHLTSGRSHNLFVEAHYETFKQYKYNGFLVQGETDGYAFTFDFGYPNGKDDGSHILGDCLTQANGTKFSTYDVDNGLSNDNCADIHKSGWWFMTCGGYNPTGQPQHGELMSFDPTSLSWPVNGNFSPDYLHIFLQHE